MSKFLCLCGEQLVVIEDTRLYYAVDTEDGTLKHPEPADDIGGFVIECNNTRCPVTTVKFDIDWNNGNYGILIPREDN